VHKYERLLRRVEAIENQIRPVEMMFQTAGPGEEFPELPAGPRDQLIFKVRYLSEAETQADCGGGGGRDREGRR